MILNKIDNGHWTWGDNHIRYSPSFGNSGWFWDRENQGIFFGADTREDFLQVLDQIQGDKHCPKMQPKPAGKR